VPTRLASLLVVLAVLAPAGASAEHKCQCLYHGKKFEQGELVCLRVDGATRLARCDMLLNNSSWTFVQTGCPTALLMPVPAAAPPRPLKVD
jgi:uncharacterized membrane protein